MMKRRLSLMVLATIVSILMANAQGVIKDDGKCGNNAEWTFDGQTLVISRASDKVLTFSIPEYDMDKNQAPWIKRKLPIRKVKFGAGLQRIGACAFAKCDKLQSVEFMGDRDFSEIGWGAFFECRNLFIFSIPTNTRKIERIAFANCSSLVSVKIPGQAVVEDMAFLSCTKLNPIEIAPTVMLGRLVFATEVTEGGVRSHKYYEGNILSLPTNVTVANSQEFGLSKNAVQHYFDSRSSTKVLAENTVTSNVDTDIPESYNTRNDTYALIIGNEQYRFVPNVPYASHDAHVFAEYCKKALGIPAENIHLCEDATKHMILEEEIGDWLTNEVQNHDSKKLIVYYAGHGVPDRRDQNKAYLLPTDVYGTKPQHGIALDDFYARLGDLAYNQVTVFMDACFSGINRDNEGVNEGLRGVEIDAEPGKLSSGNLVVFTAAQGNETAQGYLQEGHGLFTYYLLKGLQETYGSVSYGQLANYLQENVSHKAPQLNLRKKQTPTAAASDAIADTWQNIFF